MPDPSRLSRYENAVLPHLDAAYNLARWLTGNEQDARDVVQDACLRAFRAFDGFYGENGRAWLLTIVRNTSYTWLHKNRGSSLMDEFDEKIHADTPSSRAGDPSAAMVIAEDERRVAAAMERLPAEFREVLVLRHQEGLSYREIAAVTAIPAGTVMSRLARARSHLRELLRDPNVGVPS